MKSFIFLLLTLTTISFANSCYDFAKIENKAEKPINTALFVLIDQTTLFNKDLQQQILKNATTQIGQGNYTYVARFSAFINGYYNEKVFEFNMDYPLDDNKRFNIQKSKLGKFDKCLKDQRNYVNFKIQDSISTTFLKEGEDIPKSDILFAFQDFSNVISETQANRKIVLIASDMLENSVISSFYQKGSLRQINPEKELQKVEQENLYGNFGGAEIYIIGAGITNTKLSKSSYKDPRKLMALKKFWMSYFEKSNGKLIELGQPTLNRMID